jgi:hypothetical protein
MEMHWLGERQVRRALQDGGRRVVDIQLTNSINPAFNGRD